MESGFGWACEYGRNAVVEFLLDRGVDLRAGEKINQTGLHWAVIGGALETVNLLLKRGCASKARRGTATSNDSKSRRVGG